MSLSTAIPPRIKPNSGYPNQPAHLRNLIKLYADRNESKGPYKAQRADPVSPRVHKTK